MLRSSSTWLICAVFAGALLACPEKRPEGGATSASASANATTKASTQVASAAPTPSASTPDKDDDGDENSASVPSTTASASASSTAKTTATTANATANATAKATTSAVASAGPAPGSCGAKDQPKCPLQAWMAGNMQPAMAAGDAAKLAAALRASAKFAPPGYSDWAKIATDGAAAVDAAKDVSAGKPACKSCHGEYQKRYRTEMRERPI